MSIAFVAHRGSNTNKTSGTTISVSPSANLAVGALIIVRCTSDNIGGSTGETDWHAISDSKGNTWTKIREHTPTSFYGSGTDAGSVATHSTYVSKLTVAITTSDTITLTIDSAVTAKTIAIEEFSVPEDKIFSVIKSVVSADNQTYDLSMTVSVNQEYLWIAHTGEEPRYDSGSHTQDSDYSGALTIGTTGGGLRSNVGSHWGHRVFTGDMDTYSVGIAGTTDSGQINSGIIFTAIGEINDPDFTAPGGGGWFIF